MYFLILLETFLIAAKVFLSGGLKSELIPGAFANFLPYAVDVSSGVEDSPGIKSPEKIRTFISSVKKAVQFAGTE